MCVEYGICAIGCAVIVVIMLLFGICYALFELVGLFRSLFELYGGFSDDETE